MTPSESGRLINLQQERLRRGMPRYHREPIQTWRRKVKLTVAATALLGLLAGLLSIALESVDDERGVKDEGSLFDDSPFQSSAQEEEAPSAGAGSAWFATEGGGKR